MTGPYNRYTLLWLFPRNAIIAFTGALIDTIYHPEMAANAHDNSVATVVDYCYPDQVHSLPHNLTGTAIPPPPCLILHLFIPSRRCTGRLLSSSESAFYFISNNNIR